MTGTQLSREEGINVRSKCHDSCGFGCKASWIFTNGLVGALGMFWTHFGLISLVMVPKDSSQKTKSQCPRKPSILRPISGSDINERFGVGAAKYTGNLFYYAEFDAEFDLCKEVDIRVEVKTQAVIGGTTIRFKSLRDGTGNVWVDFHGENQIRLGSEKCGKSVIMPN